MVAPLAMRTRREPLHDRKESPDATIRLDDYMPYNLVVAADRVVKLVGREQQRLFGLTLPQWRIIATLAVDGPLSHQEIAQRAVIDMAALSRAAAQLTQKRLIFRHEGGDRRVRTIELTPSGRDLYANLVPLALDIERNLQAGLTEEERAALQRALFKIRNAAEQLFSRQSDE